MLDNVMDIFVYIAYGIEVTLAVAGIALLIGFVLGVVLAVLRYNGICSIGIALFVSVIRGTPVLLQLSFFYFLLPALLSLHLSVFWASCLTLGINSSAYIAELVRSGIESIPQGQFEAGKALQIPFWYMWKDVILPQVLRKILPAFVSEVTVIVKETALISVIGGLDVMRRAQLVAAKEFSYFIPLLSAGIIYYVLVMCIERIGVYLENKFPVV